MSTTKASAAPSDQMCEKPCESYTAKLIVSDRDNGIMLLLKAYRKTMRHNDTTIFHNMHCAPLSIFNLLTQLFFMV